MQETIWEPIATDFLNETPDLRQIFIDNASVLIFLEFNQSLVKLNFDSVETSRVIQEGRAFNLLKTLTDSDKQRKYWFFKTHNSAFLDWYNNESDNLYKDRACNYIICTLDCFIEIISIYHYKII